MRFRTNLSVFALKAILRRSFLASIATLGLTCPAQAADSQTPFYMPDVTDKAALKKGLMQFAKEPNNEQVFYLAVQCYLSDRDFKTAHLTVLNAAKAHPDWASPFYFQALEAEQMLNDADALRCYANCYKANPAWMKVAIQYAEALRLDYKYRQAIVKCNEALAICAHAPTDKRVKRDVKALKQIKAQSYFDLRSYPQAIEVLTEMTRGERDLPAESLLARACVGGAKYEQAIKVSTRTLALYPNDSYTRFARASAYVALKESDKAMADLDYMLAHNVKETNHPTNDLRIESNVRTLRLSIFKSRGDRKSAIQEIATLKKLTSESYQDTPFQHHSRESRPPQGF